MNNNHQPPDIYAPGTHLTVGTHQVVINKYFNQGGFAQVYTCMISPSWGQHRLACLKRVTVPDKGSLGTLRKEVDAMRKLQGIHCIVSYIDSHAARSHGGLGPGYEVFVLMEYCSNKGLIDFMNSRLVNKLKEPEILLIMEQITEAVAHMHALNPPLIHRDIKIENVLIGDDGTYKLCDFGSVCTPISPPKNIEEFQIVQDDIMKNTTPQYRSPEMLDLYKGKAINEKSDIWALGIFLYKLCYYTTPFEQNAINGNVNGYSGDYAIINGIYSFPPSPPYSARLKNVIARLLNVDADIRPNVFQLLEEICKMRGTQCPRISNQNTKYLAMPQQKLNLLNNSVTGFNKQMNGSVNKNTQMPGSPLSIKASSSGISTSNKLPGKVTAPHDASFSSNELYKSVTNSIPSTSSNISVENLSPTKVRNTKSRRPLSMYVNQDLNRRSSRESLDIKNFMHELSNEETVRLSPSRGDKKYKSNAVDSSENISSSIDYIKSISRQNTNQSVYNLGAGSNTGPAPGSRNVSKSKKRSSITSIKNLLTGGSSKGQNSDPVETSKQKRKSSTQKYKRETSTDLSPDYKFNFKNITSSLTDLKEMSPETKKPSKFSADNLQSNLSLKSLSLKDQETENLLTLTATHPGFHRASSIENRIKNLFNNTSPPVKTASGYGKYTETANSETERHFSKPKKAETVDPNYFRSVDKKSEALNPVNTMQKNKPPPPKPKKPEFLKTASTAGKMAGSEEDLDLLEKRFKTNFPGIV